MSDPSQSMSSYVGDFMSRITGRLLQTTNNAPTNSNQQTTTESMTITLLISFFAYVIIQTVFEYNRFYKQIYLKRLQRRFQSVGRAPPTPQIAMFGWLSEIWKLSELDVLRMVGLDAYMLLRYQTICFKLALFMCFWGILVLLPVYSTAASENDWAQYTLTNVANAAGDSRYRLWFAALFGYIFSAYFCQLLYAEYNNFSVRRLQYLVQADPDSPFGDPDTPQQKYFTIMVERIPSHLRSKAALEKFFDNLFPGEVYTVEVALDLSELNSLSNKRRAIRDKLEKTVAAYEATGQRPKMFVQTFMTAGDMEILNMDEATGCLAALQKYTDPESFGYEPVDALSYYTSKLIDLNKKMLELQRVYSENAVKSDKALEKKIRQRHDTRAAAIVETMTQSSSELFSSFKKEGRRFSVDSVLFGPKSQDYKQVVEHEMLKVEVLSTPTKQAPSDIPSARRSVPAYEPQALSTQREETAADIQQEEEEEESKSGPAYPEEDEDDFVRVAERTRSRVNSIAAADDLEFDSEGRLIAPNSGGRTFVGWKKSSSPGQLLPSVNEKGFTVFEESAPKVVKEGGSGRNSARNSPDRSKIQSGRAPLDVDTRRHKSGQGTLVPGTEPVINPMHSGTTGDSTANDEDAQGTASSFPNLPSIALPEIPIDSEAIEKAKQAATEAGRQGWAQTKLAGYGAYQSFLEVERAFEMLTFGAYYKYSTTAFVTFNSRITESICHQMMLSHDAMEISHAPNPSDIIWENIAIPKSQVAMRSFIVNVGLSVASLFWSSLVNSINSLGRLLGFSEFGQQYFSVLVMLVFLLILPFIFDTLARYYEGMKLESEIQNSIMTRYFYYQLVNIYVTVGFGTDEIVNQIIQIFNNPHILVEILGSTVPSVSLYFTSLMIVKIFVAVPLEMIRPYQLSTILFMANFMDRRKCTRRDLRTGAFYSWPMLYGWVYPQLMMVLMIQVTYACICPFLMMFCALFFVFSYTMYKYQLLYVYINNNQSGGFMWYAVFNRSLIALIFAALTLLGYLALDLTSTYFAGPFFFLLPLPFCIGYFWSYCHAKFKKQSMNLSLAFAKELDYRNKERKAAGKPVPHDFFRPEAYRQPSLTERQVFPEPYRIDGSEDLLNRSVEMADLDTSNLSSRSLQATGYGSNWRSRDRRGSMSLNVHEHIDEDEVDQRVSEEYFHEFVVPLATTEPDPELADVRGRSHTPLRPGGGHATHATPRRIHIDQPETPHSIDENEEELMYSNEPFQRQGADSRQTYAQIPQNNPPLGSNERKPRVRFNE